MLSEDSVTHRMNTEGVDLLTLAGVNDANLIELARLTGAKVTLRGDTLTLAGPSASVEPAAVLVTAVVGMGGIAIGVGAPMPPVMSTRSRPDWAGWACAAVEGGIVASCATAGVARPIRPASIQRGAIRILLSILSAEVARREHHVEIFPAALVQVGRQSLERRAA